MNQRRLQQKNNHLSHLSSQVMEQATHFHFLENTFWSNYYRYAFIPPLMLVYVVRWAGRADGVPHR